MTAKKKTTIQVLAVIFSLIAIIAAVYIYQNWYVKNTYNTALELIDNNSFEQAKTKLETIEENYYKDTSDLIELCKAHISYDSGCTGVYQNIDHLKFEYQTKERKEKINAFIEKSRTEYQQFWDDLIKRSNQNSAKNTVSSRPSYSFSKSSSTYKSKSYSSKSYSDDDDKYNIKDYKFAEDFYEDHFDDFSDFEDAEDYFNDHSD